MPSFRLPFSIWKIPVSKVSRTQPPCWLCFVWLRLRREKWKRCVRTHGCWVKLLLQSWMWSSPAAPELLSKCPRGGLFVFSEVTFWHKAGTLYRHVCSMLTRVIDWRGAGEAPMVTRPAMSYRASLTYMGLNGFLIIPHSHLGFRFADCYYIP